MVFYIHHNIDDDDYCYIFLSILNNIITLFVDVTIDLTQPITYKH